MTCLASIAVQAGGSLRPLVIPFEQSGGTGIMNPSIYLDGDKLLCAIRHTNYVLYHAEKLKFPHTYGPLQYINPEDDVYLRTDIFIAELDRTTLEVIKSRPVVMLPIEPVNAQFIGLEDARLFRWEGKLYLCGVRRDTSPDGQGRMELSEIELDGEQYREVSRQRMPIPGSGDSFCEKNWMPILDNPYQFVKWMRPTEIVAYSPVDKTTKTVELSEPNPLIVSDLRGGSQLLVYDKYKIAVVHETFLKPTLVGHKNASYKHRIVAFDANYKIIAQSELFSFMGAEIEFCCGLAFVGGHFLMSFGFQDNCAFVLKCPESLVLELLHL